MSIAYDGTNYSGWQIQPNRKTIQETIQNSLSVLFKKKEIPIFAAGRTDKGVHAIEQTAHFSLEEEFDIKKLFSLNGILPKDIFITKIEQEQKNFHARLSAKYKTYKYFLKTTNFCPFLEKYYLFYKKKIDFFLLKKAASKFIGTHDFTSFSNTNTNVKNKIRTIKKLNIEKKEDLITFEITANGFLYKMVRTIIGTLLDVACNKIKLSEIEKIFIAKDRKKASQAIASKGLFLTKVHYFDETKKSSNDIKCTIFPSFFS